jgi:hypothetical protein
VPLTLIPTRTQPRRAERASVRGWHGVNGMSLNTDACCKGHDGLNHADAPLGAQGRRPVKEALPA